ncbi:hypothetical protein [Cumulibacter manganitolerans]|nr:hypothetical protein [Cumulibacter manganitolerans]
MLALAILAIIITTVLVLSSRDPDPPQSAGTTVSAVDVQQEDLR